MLAGATLLARPRVTLNLQWTVIKLKWGCFDTNAGFKDLMCCHTSIRMENILEGGGGQSTEYGPAWLYSGGGLPTGDSGIGVLLGEPL